jgi:hypothetical protein
LKVEFFLQATLNPAQIQHSRLLGQQLLIMLLALRASVRVASRVAQPIRVVSVRTIFTQRQPLADIMDHMETQDLGDQVITDAEHGRVVTNSAEILIGTPDATVLLVCEHGSFRIPEPWQCEENDAPIVFGVSCTHSLAGCLTNSLRVL